MTARAVVLAAVLLSACATARPPQQSLAPSSIPAESLPVCGFEEPYLPDPCKKLVAGEWLRISNPKPKETKKHGWLWWLLVAGLL